MIRSIAAPGRIVKEFALPDSGVPTVEVLDFHWAPLNLYVALRVPNETHPATDHVSLQICPMRDQSSFYFWNVPAPAPRLVAGGPTRRVFAMVACAHPGFEAFEARLVVAGSVVAVAAFERRFGADRLVGGVALGAVSRPIAPLLITGTQKSGTTWIETIVDTSPDVLVLHEGNTLNTLDHRATRATFEARLPEFQRRAFIRWRPALPIAEELAMFAQVSVAKNLFDLLGATFGLRTVVDRTPGSSESYHFLIKFWRECRYVHVVRHPLDVFVSRLFHEAALGRGRTPEVAQLDPATLAWLVRRVKAMGGDAVAPGVLVDDEHLRAGVFDALFMQWRVDQQKLLEVLPFAAERFLVVRYEDLVERFEHEARRLLAFVDGAAPDVAGLAAIRAATSFTALSGGRGSGQEDRTSFFRNGRVGDYRAYLDAGQIASLWSRVAPVAREFSYRID